MIVPSTDIFTDVINNYYHEPYASLMNGILFGVDIEVSDTFYNQLKRVGLLHIVVLSGMNITFLAAIVSNMTSRLSKKVSAILSIAAIVVFIMFVGGDPPIVRAGITGVLGLIAVIYGRKKTALYSLFLSGLLIFIFKREWIESVSFQLSFGATLGIILFGPRSTMPKTQLDEIFFYFKDDLRTSLAAQLFTAPIIFIYFREISFIAPFSNILISFVIAPLMVLGFIAAVLGKIHYVLGLIPAYMGLGILHYVVIIVELMDSIPGIFVAL